MKRVIISETLLLLTGCSLLPAYAAVLHKWVDAEGVTHYSDLAPEPEATQVTMIDVPDRNPVKTAADNGYYSIKNQWQRVHKERLEREKLKLENTRLKAAPEPATPQVVCIINEPREKHYAVAYPGSFHHRHHHGRWYKKYKPGYGYASKRYYRGKTPPGLHAGRMKLVSYQHF